MKNKHTNLSSNQTIKEAIRKIAWRGMVNNDTGAIKGTGKVSGYVAKIHTDGDLAGTIDVQEYVSLAVDESEEMNMGYHEGVLLSAIQDNSKGLLIIPKLYSEVVVTQDPETGTEYVSMFSHVDVIQLDSHDTISIGVKEREKFDEGDEEGPDVHELEETGVMTNTTYTKDSIVTNVQGENDANKVQQTIDSTQIKQVVGDDKSSSTMTQDGINLKHDKASLDLTDDEATVAMGSSKVKVENGTVYVGSDSSTDDAVLGVELATILSDLLGYISQIMTATMMGPQPPANIASFISLKAKIEAFKSSHSGFLTKKVQIQK